MTALGVLAVALVTGVGPAATTVTEAQVYAHRGGAAEAPENTLAAFRQSWDRYAAAGIWLELDAQLAADGELVVIHDHTLERTTDCEGLVADRTSDELAACDAAAGYDGPGDFGFESVPTLHDVLAEGRDAGWKLMVELKNIPGEANFDPAGATAARALADLLDATGFDPERLVVQSFFPTSLDWMEVLRPDVRTALLTTSTLPGGPEGAGFLVAENAVYAAARGYEVSAPDARSVDMSAETVAAAHASGREVVTWTVDDPARAVELAGFGVDGVITNRPGAVLEALGS